MRIRAIVAVFLFLVAAVRPLHAGGMVERGHQYLLANQAEDGSWMHDTAFTGLALRALVETGMKDSADPVARGIRFLLARQQANGAIYIEERGLANYSTSIAVTALAATGNPAYNKAIRRARAFLVKGPLDEGENYDTSNHFYGGAGYGSKPGRTDMSNTHFMLEAWRAAGLDRDDPAWERALTFLNRCQNRRATNDQDFSSDDGGFVYSPVESKAGEVRLADGCKGLRSYGSMTYAGLMSMIYANVAKDDGRVQAAVNWARKHWTMDENPGMGAQGLFYYYHTMAKALDVYGEDLVVDASGAPHRWKEELRARLASLQAPNGSWVNANSRWMESDPVLVTAYALLVLARTGG